MILNFKIQKKILTKINYQQTVKTPGIYKCKFYFDEQTWKDLEIFVVFKNNFGYSTIVPLGKYTESMSCSIPNRIATSKYFKMFIYAKDHFQTNTISVVLSEQCKTTTKRTNALNDILKQLENKIDNITFNENQLKCFANGKLVDTIYIDNVDEVLIEERIQQNLGSFRDEINEQLKEYVKIDDICFEDGIINFK